MPKVEVSPSSNFPGSFAFPGLNPNPVAEVDEDGRVKFINASGRRLFPDLQLRQIDHPWLSDWPPPAREAGPRGLTREIAVDDRWFRQDIIWADKSGTYLVYGFDITDAKRAQEALRESENRVSKKLQSITSPTGDIASLELSDILDIPALQGLLNSLHGLTGLSMAVIDDNGKVLAGIDWQDICTKFHRIHPETCKNCLASDIRLTAGIAAGEWRAYKCKNGLRDAATPLMVDDRRMGNLFCGQFAFDDEEPNRDFFRAQAARYDFPENEYLAALDRVPRLSRRFVETTMEFIAGLAQSLSKASWNNINLARSMALSQRRGDMLRRANRALAARNLIDRAMIRAKDEVEFTQEACAIVRQVLGHAMVWIGSAEQDAGKTVKPLAYSGYETGYLAAARITWADTKRGRGPVGTAVRTGKARICHNVLTDPNFKPWRRGALGRGYASVMALPLQSDQKVIGVLAIYSKTSGVFNEHEANILSGLAGDLGYGIGALRMRVALKQADVQFKEAQKMEAVGLLAGGIAHDFNNILAILGGYNHLLLEELKPGRPERAYSQEIQHSLEIGGALTHQLLGISGNRDAVRHCFDPNSVILQMSKMLRRLLYANIKLATALHRSVWSVKMGSGQLEQIILNLVVNARDAMPKGGSLTVSTKNTSVKIGGPPRAGMPSAPGHYVVLEVRDTGTGIAPAVKERLFEPFFTTKGRGRGTGLGLSTVRNIVQEHKGEIAVESRLGRGTLFRVYLPSTNSGAKGMMKKAVSMKSAPRDGKILVVEDNESLLKITKLALQKAGYTVYSARSGEELLAISAGLKSSPDILLCDVVLPDFDGPELAKQVKELWPAIRTVYMSGYPGNALGPITGFGGCVLLEKPFSSDLLLKTMRETMARAQADLF